jgi:hypothetical protein
MDGIKEQVSNLVTGYPLITIGLIIVLIIVVIIMTLSKYGYNIPVPGRAKKELLSDDSELDELINSIHKKQRK